MKEKAHRTLVIGDIHGGLKSLLQVLERSGFDNQRDRLIILGDIVDGWSESAQCVDFFIKLQEESKFGHIFIRGNHDHWCENWLTYGAIDENWYKQGGGATISSYITTDNKDNIDHELFFRRMTYYYLENNKLFVHGGFTDVRGVGYEYNKSEYFWNRSLWESALMHRPFHRYGNYDEIYIGHTDTTNYKCKRHYPEYNMPEQTYKNGGIIVPMLRHNIYNLDTGGGFSGKLSIMDIDSKEFWQSDLLSELYKDEYDAIILDIKKSNNKQKRGFY